MLQEFEIMKNDSNLSLALTDVPPPIPQQNQPSSHGTKSPWIPNDPTEPNHHRSWNKHNHWGNVFADRVLPETKPPAFAPRLERPRKANVHHFRIEATMRVTS